MLFRSEWVCAVAASSRAVAEDALELIEVDYEPLPAHTDTASAMQKNTLARDLAFAAIGLVALLLVPMLGSKAATNFIIYVSANGLLAMSLNLLVGYTGLVSFGHAMFFGAAGAYPFVLLMQNLLMLHSLLM